MVEVDHKVKWRQRVTQVGNTKVKMQKLMVGASLTIRSPVSPIAMLPWDLAVQFSLNQSATWLRCLLLLISLGIFIMNSPCTILRLFLAKRRAQITQVQRTAGKIVVGLPSYCCLNKTSVPFRRLPPDLCISSAACTAGIILELQIFSLRVSLGGWALAHLQSSHTVSRIICLFFWGEVLFTAFSRCSKRSMTQNGYRQKGKSRPVWF